MIRRSSVRPKQSVNAAERASAAAFFLDDEGNVARPVADEGRSFLCDRRNDEFALLPVLERFAGCGIDDLGEPEILIHVHAVLGFAFEGDAGSGDLGQSVNIVGLDVPGFLDFLPHVLRPGLGAEAARAESELRRIDAHFLRLLGEVERVRGRTGNDGRLEVADKHKLFLRVAGRNGDDGRADFRRTIVRTQTAGKKAIAVGVLDGVVP